MTKTPMTWERIQELRDDACVRLAADRPEVNCQTGLLDPRLWEDLRIEMQRRLRAATGEQDAIVRFEFGAKP